MDAQIQSDTTATTNHLPFEVVALVLEGGGALGADQAGVYEALSEGGIHPNLDCGNVDRRHQCGDHCRQSAEFSSRTLARILDASDRPRTVVRSGLHGLGPRRRHAPARASGSPALSPRVH